MGATQSLVRENTSNSKKGNSLFFSINLYALQERHSQNGVAEAVATKKKNISNRWLETVENRKICHKMSFNFVLHISPITFLGEGS